MEATVSVDSADSAAASTDMPMDVMSEELTQQTSIPKQTQPQNLDVNPSMPMPKVSADLQWYIAATRLGKVYVGLDAALSAASDQDVVTMIGKAKLLASAEMFIQAFEQWQDLELDLTPALQPDDEMFVLRVHPIIDKLSTSATIAFEKSAIEQLNFMTPKFAEQFAIESEPASAAITLDELLISSDEYKLLSEGAMVLLPSSFNEHWVVQTKLSGAVGEASTRFAINKSTQALMVLDQQHASELQQSSDARKQLCNAGQCIHLSVQLKASVALPWTLILALSNNTFMQTVAITNAAVSIAEDGREIAIGNVCKVGGGYGVVIGGMS